MADSEVFKSKDNGSLWIIPNGPNTKPEYLKCYDLEDVSETNGSITLIQCINERGEYETIGSTIAPPEPTTTTLGTYIGRVADWIETVKCPFGLYVTLGCGKKGIFDNWDRAMLIQVQTVANRTRSGLVRKDEDVAAMHTFNIEAAPGVTDFFRLTSISQPLDAGLAGRGLTALAFTDDVGCWDSCGSTVGECEDGVISTTSDTGVEAHVLLSPSLGGTTTWSPSSADPFAADEDIADVIMVKISRTVTRIIAVRGTTDAGNPMEIAYSDDNGATWVNVDVGSTNGEFAASNGVLAAPSPYDIFLVSNLGRIYKSEDGGKTWDVKEDASITATAYYGIAMLNPQIGYAIGDLGLVVKTIDGGKTWSQTATTAGSAILFSVAVLGRNRVWVGAGNGLLYYSTDGGETWSTRTVDTTAAVSYQKWYNDYFGVIANGYTVRFTINGGYSWDSIPDTTNLHTGSFAVAVAVCNTRNIYSLSSTSVVQSAI